MATAQRPAGTDKDQKANENSNFGTGEGETSPNAKDKAIEGANVDTSVAEKIASGDKVNVYNLHAGLAPRVGGPYLDIVQLEQAEIQRALIEGREPDFDNMAGSAGVPLVTAAQLVQAHTNASVDSVVSGMVESNADNDKVGPKPVTQVDHVGTDVNLHAAEEYDATKDPTSPEFDQTKVTSHDNHYGRSAKEVNAAAIAGNSNF